MRLIEQLTRTFERSGALGAFWEKLDCGYDATLAVASTARPFMVATRFTHCPQPTLVVVAGEEAAQTFARSVAAYVGDESVLRFPSRKDHPFNPKAPDISAIGRRMRAAYALQSGRDCIVVASAQALLRCMPPAKARVAAPLVMREGSDVCCSAMHDALEYANLPRELEKRGFANTAELDGPGTFAVHGGTIDIFPGTVPYPIRVEFFGDEVDEIRRIIPSTGQTIATLKEFEVYPVREYSCDDALLERARTRLEKQARTNPVMRDLCEKLEGKVRFDGEDALLPFLYPETATLGDYAGQGTLSVLVEPRSLFDDASHAFEDVCARSKGTGIPVAGLYADPATIEFGRGVRANYLSIMRVGGAVDAELPVKRVDIAGHPDKMYGRLRSLLDGGMATVLSVPHYRARKDIEMALVDEHIPFQELMEAGSPEPVRLRRDVVNVVDTDIPIGMIFPKAKLALVSLGDTQGASSRRVSGDVDITQITFPYNPGDYVVHAAHGIALFKELVRRDVDGTVRDYLLLEYAENDKLFVPVEQLDRVTRYVGPEGASPRLTRLNTSDWSRAVSKARKATKKLAFDLVDVYARRASSQGFRFSEDTVWQTEMEEAFPYQETPDQLIAIAEVKADMQSIRPMDRLVCGDVGFGKTEVALRAAFKATQDGKQVMVLCPTTILAQQHFVLFNDRCAPFGVRVEVLSRFRTPQQQAEALEGFKSGEVQILVGTHRLLSRDVNPHDLGLVIIDEEQRFGVGHKEQFKNMRESVDVLTLSATPIPRTMQMSISGVRDMSLILSPPDDRRPVKVHVGEWDPDVVCAAIRHELARNGQVYYVSNRVRTIDDALRRVEQAAPEARVGVAHGKLSKDALEKVMEEFSAGALDVLVATTIIESGIDNPHTNTLIIEDSQRLGLSQMYQLKGRVGRSSTQAYAFFMFPENIPLTEEAQSRLMALDEHQELGSGLRIAMRDLEIRGAGNLLGAEQSGNMSAVGFDLFAQMLAQAVNATREGDEKAADSLPPALSDISINIPGHAYIPEEYMSDVDERVLWYRKIASAATVEAVDTLQSDMLERHPGMPQATCNLFSKARMKAFSNERGIQTVSIVAGRLLVEPISITKEQGIKFRRYGGRYVADSKRLSVPLKYFKLEAEDSLLEVVSAFLQTL